MALEYEDMIPGTGQSAFLAHARQFEARPTGEAYEGMGDDPVAQPDLVCGVAQLAGEPALGAGELGARHPLEP